MRQWEPTVAAMERSELVFGVLFQVSGLAENLPATLGDMTASPPPAAADAVRLAWADNAL